MSKLSEAVKQIEENTINEKDWDIIAERAADDILNLEFNYYVDRNRAVLLCKRLYKEYYVVVSINIVSRTTSYTISVTKDRDDIYTLVKFKDFTNLTGLNGEEVDIGELKTYLKSITPDGGTTEKVYETVSQTSTTKTLNKKAKLNEEIDKGFRRQDSRAALGGETLENDIAFNEYLHRKTYGSRKTY